MHHGLTIGIKRSDYLILTICILLMPAIARSQTIDSSQPASGQERVAQELVKRPVDLTASEISSMQRKLLDWPQLGRYETENRKLTEDSSSEPRVIFFGDSITDGWGRVHGHFFPDEGWINRGISGQTTPQMLVRFEQDVLALRPTVVVILAGINDLAGNTGFESMESIESNFRAMVTLAQGAGVRVILCSLLPASGFTWRPGIDPRGGIGTLNAWLQGFSQEQGLVYLDYFSAMVGPDRGMRPSLTIDGVHPSDAGYAVMEPLARAAVQKMLAAHLPAGSPIKSRRPQNK